VHGAIARPILVTGGAGFIGSEVVRQLAAAGERVVVLDNLSHGSASRLAGLPAERVRLVVGDVRDARLVAALLAEAGTVYHLACLGLRHSLHAPRENHEVNATATLGLLELARQAAVARFVHVSSSEVYGSAGEVPMSEQHPTRPTTVYGAAKLAGESYARACGATHGLPVVVVRPFNSFGPHGHHEGDSGEAIPRFLLRAMAGRPLTVFGDGTQTRDFTYVTDTARGIRLAGGAAAAVGRTINLGSGRETAIGDLARRIAARYAGSGSGTPGAAVRHDLTRPGDVRRQCAGVGLAASLLGYRPEVTLEEGLDRLHAWYQAEGGAAGRLLHEEAGEINWIP
jgi:UDP-glucose 4-epimerase